jgi:hypothetical protein
LMSMEFANRICPSCWNPNYVVFLGDFSKAYKYKCMNCNYYFNDIDIDEPSAPDWKTEHMNSKVDMVEVIRCKNCKWWHHNSTCYNEKVRFGSYRKPDWFCADGERRTD